MFNKTKNKTGKSINLKIYLLVHGQKLIFNLGISLKYIYQFLTFIASLIFVETSNGYTNLNIGLIPSNIGHEHI